MQLTFDSKTTGHPLIKNANGTLRLGRWWVLSPEDSYRYAVAYRSLTATTWGMNVVQLVHDDVWAASWTTSSYASTGGYVFPYIGGEFRSAYATSTLNRRRMGYFSTCAWEYVIPAALQTRIWRAIKIVDVGGCVKAYKDSSGNIIFDLTPGGTNYPSPMYWDYSSGPEYGVIGYNLFKNTAPSTPAAGMSYPVLTSTNYNTLDTLSRTVVGYTDPSDFLQVGNTGSYQFAIYNWVGVLKSQWARITTPAGTASSFNDGTSIWVCGYPYSPTSTVSPSFTIDYNSTKYAEIKLAYVQTPYLAIYA